MFASRTALRASDVVIRAAIVGLALATGYIHFTLGGLLFTLNAIGYVVAAVAMIVPLALAVRFRWVVRLGLIGYAATDDRRLGDPGPVLPDRLHRQGHRGRADRPASPSTSPAMDGNPITVVKRELAVLRRARHRSAAARRDAGA